MENLPEEKKLTPEEALEQYTKETEAEVERVDGLLENLKHGQKTRLIKAIFDLVGNKEAPTSFAEEEDLNEVYFIFRRTLDYLVFNGVNDTLRELTTPKGETNGSESEQT